MVCPRCGLQNPPDISACQRCGLAVAPPPPSDSPASGRPGYGQPGYGPPGYARPGYDPPGYAQPGYGQAPYGPPYGQAAYPSYGQPPGATQYQGPYAPAGASPYSAGPVSPYGNRATWPADAASTRKGAGFARLLLFLGAAASLAYAVWAFTARRGIFADFADNKVVSLGHAKSSDRTDTILLVVAGALTVIALVMWLIRLIAGRSRGGFLAVLGFLLCLGGIASVVVGLVLSGNVGDGTSRVHEGEKAITSTVVTGSGFIALAVGLLIGMLVAKARAESPANGDATRGGSAGGPTTTMPGVVSST